MLSKISKAGSPAQLTHTGFSVSGLEFYGEEYSAIITELYTYTKNNAGSSRIEQVHTKEIKKHVMYDAAFNRLPKVSISIPVTLYCKVDEEAYKETWICHINAETGEHINGKGGFTNF